MMTDSNQTYEDHFPVYTNIESFCHTAETNIMLHVDYTSKEWFQKHKFIYNMALVIQVKIQDIGKFKLQFLIVLYFIQ